MEPSLHPKSRAEPCLYLQSTLGAVSLDPGQHSGEWARKTMAVDHQHCTVTFITALVYSCHKVHRPSCTQATRQACRQVECTANNATVPEP